ncbi:hypothetical protein DM49_4907 [Burkholderia mallei]|nr:hypothetical protein DM49_4907 [Burkholderia mallei]
MGRTLLTALMILTVPMALPARMARRFAGALADHAVARRADDLLPERMRVARRKRDRAEAFVFEQPAPGGGREHGAARFAQRRILVQPPAFEQAERQMREQRFLADLVEQQHAARAQARLHVAQRAAYLPRRMQHVGRDHDVVAARRHPLRVERPLDVEQRGAQVPGPRPERGLRVLQERLRHVGEAILADRGRVGPQPLERERRGAARARADLENADRLAPAGIDPRADMADQRVGLHRVEVIRDRIVAVHALDALHRAARKQHVGGGQPAREHVRQRAHAHVGEVDLRAPAAGRGRVEPVARPVAPDVLARIGLGDHARRAVDDAQPAARREDPQRLVPPARMARARGPSSIGRSVANVSRASHASISADTSAAPSGASRSGAGCAGCPGAASVAVSPGSTCIRCSTSGDARMQTTSRSGLPRMHWPTNRSKHANPSSSDSAPRCREPSAESSTDVSQNPQWIVPTGNAATGAIERTIASPAVVAAAYAPSRAAPENENDCADEQ